MPRIQTVSKNLGAFLDTIATSEGTPQVKGSDDGYNVIVGGTLFIGYADHPRKLVQLRPGLASTAAGRYQILARYFDAYKAMLHLPDFSPISQDLIAIQQIREAKALPAIEAGEFAEDVELCAHLWASLPGNDYKQRQNSLATLEAEYIKDGGTLDSKG